CTRKLDDAEPGDARDFRNVGGERHVPAFGDRIHHALEGADAALDVISAAATPQAAHRADAKPLGGDRVDLAVDMARDQNLERKSPAQEWQHEILAVPNRKDERLLA